MNRAVIYFDGVCNFCNGLVNFVIRHDRKDYFRYAALQSESGKKFCRENNLPTDNLETFYLYMDGKVYSHSTAGLMLLRKLGWKYSWLYVFIIIPAGIRDFLFYKPIARNRYKWFGKKDQCMIPEEEVKGKFLE
jgi:predicted DCC family thiol-disulfide oxidoreductase YuxK